MARSGQRIAAAWFLGVCFAALAILLWLRGAGRFLIPLVLVGGLAVVVLRVVRKIREPLP